MYLLTIDPGMATGIVLGYYTDDEPYERLARWQVEGGLDGFKKWFWRYHYEPYPDGTSEFELTGGWAVVTEEDGYMEIIEGDVTVVSEKFVPLPAPRSFKLNELEPIRIEGALDVMVDDVVWQRSSAMVLAGGDTPAQRKKNSDDVLRRMGLWSTGKEVHYKDANDVNSAQKHAIAYLRSIEHKPTLEFLAQ